MEPLTQPEGLGEAGEALWRSIADVYDLRPDEARTLVDAAREADLITRLETAQRDSEVIVRGSHGQPVVSGLVGELRQHRATLVRLLAALHLPEEDAGLNASTVSAAARRAARARWANRPAAGGGVNRGAS